ncbi:MAG: aminoglycoside phosphotransferase family protein [Anaerolineae bacterium]|nr:aminoglycoside phosphotransferase family protein [Anaerolineae bacterium]
MNLTALSIIASLFDLPGPIEQIEPYGSGHIHDTFRVSTGASDTILQRVNTQVFRQPEQVMENITRVLEHARTKILAEGGDAARETLRLVPARDGAVFVRDEQGGFWRMFHFIAGTRVFDSAPNLHAVYQAAYAFGRFQQRMADLPGSRLHETIPNFHHTRLRLEAFQAAVRDDPQCRAAGACAEIEILLRREPDAAVVVDLLEQRRLPERVTHNDTKINNVLFDATGQKALAVIDLDTVMPGSVLYDFGDMVRTGAVRGAEDEPDLSAVDFDPGLFTQLARGYVHAVRELITPAESELLAFSAKLITYEQALRFLGDYLSGDVYYKIHRPQHNLERARTQIKLMTQMEEQMGLLEAIVVRCLNEKTP